MKIVAVAVIFAAIMIIAMVVVALPVDHDVHVVGAIAVGSVARDDGERHTGELPSASRTVGGEVNDTPRDAAVAPVEAGAAGPFWLPSALAWNSLGVGIVPVRDGGSGQLIPSILWQRDGPLRGAERIRGFAEVHPECAGFAVTLDNSPWGGPRLGCVDDDSGKHPPGDLPRPKPLGGYHESTRSGGTHDFFRYPSSLPANTPTRVTGLGGFVDILAEGIVYVAPTTNAGGVYRAIAGLTESGVPIVPEMPSVSIALGRAAPWLLEEWRKRRTPTGGRATGVPLGADGKLPHGRHHEWIRTFTSSFVSKTPGATEDQIVEAGRSAFEVIADDLPNHEKEFRNLARSALAKYGESAGAGRPDRAALEDELLGSRRFVALRDSRELRIYDETRGFYVPEADTYIAEWVRSRFTEEGYTATQNFINEIVATVRDRSYRDRATLNPSWFVAVRNGVLNIKTGELKPHSPDLLFTFGLPVRYDPAAICLKFDAFLNRALPDATLREAVLEFAGYLLWPGQPLRKLLVAHGPTTTGKSTFADVLREVYGPENVSSVDLAGLADNHFKAAELVDKIANVRADIPWKLIRNLGLVQELTGGRDVVEAERKYQHPFSFRPSAKLVFSCNRLPPVPGATPAFWKRVYLTPWDIPVPPEVEQKDYALTLLEERDGIFRRFFEASQRLSNRGHLPELPVDTADRWLRSSDPALWVAQHELMDDSDRSVELDAVVARVDQVAEEENVENPPSQRQVAAAIRRIYPRVRADRPWIGKERRTVYRGVRWRVRIEGDGDVASKAISDVEGPSLDTYLSQPSADAREREEGVGEFPAPSVQSEPLSNEKYPGRHVSRGSFEQAQREEELR